ncbi:MAG: hypothetical protein IIV78_06710, partial [Oscillospiraceae bacterium]|nr:hypothetical protein [Oscillospiraceae bacterium]
SNSTFTDNEILNNTSGAAVYVGKRATLMLDGVSVTGSIGKGAAATSGVYLWGASDAKSTFVIKGHNSIDGIAAQSASFPIVLKGAVTGSIGFYAAASTYTSFVSNGTLVLSGEKVADSYAAFTPTNSSYEFTSEGKLAVK